MNRVLFNNGWQFRRKLNRFIDRSTSEWREVTLPHDAMIGQDRDPNMELGAVTAYFPGGACEYRNTFEVPNDLRQGRVVFEFEGVYRNATVWVNGHFAGHRPSGYAGFAVDATDYVLPEQTNHIRVEARTHGDGRWYTGAGIYRDVWMWSLPPVHLGIDGVKIRTPDIEPGLAVVDVELQIVNQDSVARTVDALTRVQDPEGRLVATGGSPVTVPAGETASTHYRLYVREPHLWSVDSPTLYTAATAVRVDGYEEEQRTVTFGIRKLQLDPYSGLRINGEVVDLRGACIHHDNGIIGAATIARAEERRVEILKAAGFNAIRSTHNPASPAFLDACDRLGMLVMDEAYDGWTIDKTNYGYGVEFPEWWERDIEAFVAKDFNHPSVILYSIGNEVPETGTPFGAVWGRRLAEKIRSLDATRFITNAINGMLAAMDETREMTPDTSAQDSDAPGINDLMASIGDFMNMVGSSEAVTRKTEESFQILDVAGMNYLESRYEADLELFPNRIIVGTETFPTIIDRLWGLVKKHSHVIGDFTWTGWDYIGEVGVGRGKYPGDEGPAISGEYPWLTAWCGDIDIAGSRLGLLDYRQIVFGLRSEPYIAVQRPSHYGEPYSRGPWSWPDSICSWSWPGFEGKPVKIEIYSDAEEVELFLNGKSIGVEPAGAGHRYQCEFDTTYEPGELLAVASRGGKESGRHVVRSADGTRRIQALPDRAVVSASPQDLAYVEISLVDAAGILYNDDEEVQVRVSGPGVLQGLGSGNPATAESFVTGRHTTFDGKALAAIRPTGPGTVTVEVASKTCQAVAVDIEVRQ